MRKQYVVRLPEEERAALLTLIGRGAAPARAQMDARIPLKANRGEAGPGMDRRRDQRGAGGRPDDGGAGAQAVRDRGVGGRPAPQGTRPGVSAEAGWRAGGAPVAVACSEPPSGQKQWTLRLLANKLAALEVVDTVSYETVRQPLTQTGFKPWLIERWCILPEANPEFVYRMEDVLDVYTRPYDPKRPQVGLMRPAANCWPM